VHKPRSLSELIRGGAPRLQHLSNRAKTAIALKEAVRAALAGPLANHVTAAALRQQELTVWVDSAAFCARLRFEIPRVRDALMRTTGTPIERIRVKVQPETR
jgi:hypothetical protein